MYSKVSLILLVCVLAAAILGFGLFPGIAPEVQTVAKVLFIVLLFFLLISLFDVIGNRFRNGYDRDRRRGRS